MQHSLGQETYLKCTDDIISTVETRAPPGSGSSSGAPLAGDQ